MIKKLIKYLFFKYCFQETSIANDFVIYYIPGVIKHAPAGQYLFGKINKKSEKIESFYEITKLYDKNHGIVNIEGIKTEELP